MNSTTESETRGRFDRRFLGIGAGSGLLGGICCIGSAIAVGLGVSAISFFGAWMDRYQIYFILVSVALMILLLVNWARSTGVRPTGWTAVAVAGWAVTIIGVIVDVYWHGAHPGADETNMLGLPGHQIQLVGWILGVVGVGALLLRARAWSKGRATM